MIQNQIAALLTHPEQMTLGQMLFAIVLCYFGGVLASLTPCVYPMIPITLGVLGGASTERKTHKENLVSGFAYLAGMALVYSFLGVLAGVSGKLFGSLTQSVGWYLFLGCVFTLAALISFGVVTIDPLRWMARLGFQSQTTAPNARLLGIFALGASSGLIAAPCTTPVLSSILAFIARSQSVGLGFLLMLAFSLGLGSLLLLVIVFTGALRILPRSGQWMYTLKMISGFILIAVADYLFFLAGGLK